MAIWCEAAFPHTAFWTAFRRAAFCVEASKAMHFCIGDEVEEVFIKRKFEQSSLKFLLMPVTCSTFCLIQVQMQRFFHLHMPIVAVTQVRMLLAFMVLRVR